jgi:BirA family biotin operon repressor/biotin-[acetyl-CoA-carboxylase] ligase
LTPTSAPDSPSLPWDAPALQQQLAVGLPGLRVEVVAQTGSTNTDLLARARRAPAGDAGLPCLRVAEQQTQGRGRQGKAWQSQRGASLTFSLALPLAPADWSGLSLAVGLALADALDTAVAGQPARLGIKWPNDLLLLDAQAPGNGLGRKLGGILIETVQSGAQRLAVVGVGLNVLPLPGADEDALAWGYGCLQSLQPGIDAPAALALVAPALLQALLRFEQAGFAPLQARFAQRDVLRGQAVTTTLAHLPQGQADGVDAQGCLWLRSADGQRHSVGSGEVSLRPTAPLQTAPVEATPC